MESAEIHPAGKARLAAVRDHISLYGNPAGGTCVKEKSGKGQFTKSLDAGLKAEAACLQPLESAGVSF